MIFVTVGTHEQQFNRLIKEIDNLKKENLIKEDVFIQIGYSDYIPAYCDYSKFLSYEQMEEYMDMADIIICHGGPSTFMNALSKVKKTIIVPRLKKYGEHVNDHQLEFLEKISGIYNIEYTTEIIKLFKLIDNNFEKRKFLNNNKNFCLKFEKLILEM